MNSDPADLPGLHPSTESAAPRWVYRSRTLLVIGLVFVVRLVYLIWFCPYELLGDEAYYWEQSRHLDLCYVEKGPGLPWMIAASCRLFGDTEWAVRLPVHISFVVSALAVAWLGTALTRGNQRAGFLAMLCFLLMPAFQANAQLSTQDGPLIAIWAALTAVGLRIMQRWRSGQNTWRHWIAFWSLMGVGALLKQSIPLFLPGIAVYAFVQRKNLSWRMRSLVAQQLVGILIFAILISPMIVWNQRHGWPTLEHTAGHLGVGGDQAGQVNRGSALIWVLTTLGGLLGAFGPAAIVLMIWVGLCAWKERNDDADHWADRLWLLCAAVPSVLLFVALSFFKPVVPSWPLPALVSLMPLLGEFAMIGRLRRARIFGWFWAPLVVYGIVGWLIISFPTSFARLPIIAVQVQHPLRRITGHRADAMELQSALNALQYRGRPTPIIVARHYMQAALYAFYLPGHPTVRSADKYLGKRPTTFDQWDDTRLDNPALDGSTLLLCGEGAISWNQGLLFDSCEAVVNGRFALAHNYRGPRPDYPRAGAGAE